MLKAPIDAPLLADSVALLDPINARADSSHGFIRQLPSTPGKLWEGCHHGRTQGDDIGLSFISFFPPNAGMKGLTNALEKPHS